MIRPLVALVGLLLAASCVHAQESGIIRPSGSPMQLRLEEVLSIGSMFGEHDAFGNVTGVALDSRGRIVVADDLGHHFKVFDPSGTHLATVGRKGEGPGEFSSPWTISTGPGDSVVVWDFQRSLISVFSPEYDWVRDVRVSPAWLVNSMVPRSDGTLVVAAYGHGDRLPVKTLSPDGMILRRGGVPIDAPNLYGFEDSLLGGYLTRSDAGYVHTTKSPYVLSFLDDGLNPVRVCHGPRGLTTDPTDVLDVTERGVGIRWSEYVHAVSILALGDGVFLNTILDPVADMRTLHLVTNRCELTAEMETELPIIPYFVRGDLLVVARTHDYDEIVIYRMILEGEAQPWPARVGFGGDGPGLSRPLQSEVLSRVRSFDVTAPRTRGRS